MTTPKAMPVKTHVVNIPFPKSSSILIVIKYDLMAAYF
jgi:hypothetical protein